MLKDFSFAVISQIVSLAIPLLLYPILLDRLGPIDYAQLVIINSLSVLYGAAVNWGINVEALRIISTDSDSSSNLYSSVVLLKIYLLTSLFPLFYLYLLDLNMPPVAILGMFIISGLSIWISPWLYQYTSRFDLLMYINVIGRIIQLFLVILLVTSLNEYFFVMFCVLLVNVILSAAIRIYKFDIRFVLDHSYVKRLFIAGMKFQFSNILHRISLQFFILYFGFRGLTQDVLVVDFFEKIANLIRGFMSSWEQVLLPRLTKGRNVLSSKLYMPWLLIIFFFIAICYVVLAPYVLAFLNIEILSKERLLFLVVLLGVLLSAYVLFEFQSKLYSQGRYLFVGRTRLFSLVFMIVVFFAGKALFAQNIIWYVISYCTYEISLLLLFKLNNASKVFT